MKLYFIIMSSLGLISCGASAGPSGPLGYIVPACEHAGTSGETKKWSTSEHLFESSGARQVCAQPVSSGVEIDAPLRIVPYRSGLVDIEFKRSHQDPEEFLKKCGQGSFFHCWKSGGCKSQSP